jgi:hypothetical protein
MDPGPRDSSELLKKLQADAQRLQKEIALQQEDLGYLQKLGGFTSTALTGLTEKGRLTAKLSSLSASSSS